MSTSHFLLMVLYAFMVSVVFATIMKDDRRAQLKTFVTMFGGFIVSALVIGYLMYPFPLGS